MPEIKFIDFKTGEVTKLLRTRQVAGLCVAFSQDGKWVAVGGGDDDEHTGRATVEVWEVATDKRVATLPGHNHSVLCLAISPDKKTILTGGTDDGARVWDVATGKLRYALHWGKTTRIEQVGFLPCGRVLFTHPDGPGCAVHFWDTATGRPVSTPGLSSKQQR